MRSGFRAVTMVVGVLFLGIMNATPTVNATSAGYAQSQGAPPALAADGAGIVVTTASRASASTAAESAPTSGTSGTSVADSATTAPDSATTAPAPALTTAVQAAPTTTAPTSHVAKPSDTPQDADDTPAPANTLFDDEFNGPAGTLPDDSKWSYQVGGGGWGNDELAYYTDHDPDNASADGNGNLAITLRAEPMGGMPYTSARLDTLGKFDLLYGTIEARIKIPGGSGIWPAFWTQGKMDDANDHHAWPYAGEIDIMEVVNSDRGYSANAHGGGAYHWTQYKYVSNPPRDGKFHTYAAKLSPGRIDFYLDGKLTNSASKAKNLSGEFWPYDTFRQYLQLNVAMGGNYPGDPDGTAKLPATMFIDYIRVTK